MKNSFLKFTRLALIGGGLCLMVCAKAQATAVTLNPLFTTLPGTLALGGLAGTWYKVQNDAKFSEATWEGATIKNTTWGTGIWSASDIAAITADPRPSYVTGSTTSIGAVSYANNIYNNTFESGVYGTWGMDYMRTLAPTVGAANTCNKDTEGMVNCANEQNYAAVFTGYLYVSTESTYDFGVFADDVFNFSLTGLNGQYGMSHEAVAGSSGRVDYSLLDKNGLESLELLPGFYGIDLSYANRLEAGVIELGWKGPGDTGWRTIGGDDLYHNVPEPATDVLLAVGLIGLWVMRKRTTTMAPMLAT